MSRAADRQRVPPSDTPRGLFPSSLMSAGIETGKGSVGHLDDDPVAIPVGRNHHLHGVGPGGDAVFDRILDERLDHHGWHEHLANVHVAVDAGFERAAEPSSLHGEILLERIDLTSQRLERRGRSEQEAQVIGERLNDGVDRLRIVAAGDDRVERVEEEVRADLGLDPFEFVSQSE